MNNNPRFTKKRLSQIIAAGLLTGLGATASANDFSISNGSNQNLFVLSNGSGYSTSATVSKVDGENRGEVTLINNVPLTSSFATPDFSFTLTNNATPTNATYTFRVGVIIDDDNSTRRMEAVLDTLTLQVNGTTVTGSIANQDLRVFGRAGSVTLKATLQNNATNGPITISGGEVTFSGSRLVERLENSSLLENILGEFDTGDGDYSYSIVIVQTNGAAPAADFGIIDDNDDFVSFGTANYDSDFTLANADNNAQNDFTGNAFKVSGTFNTAAQSTGGGGGGGGTTDPDDEDDSGEEVVDNEELEELEEQAEQLDEQVDDEIASGNVSPTTVTSTTNLATESATATTNITTAIASGTTVSTTNILGALSAGSKTASTAGKVAGATTDTTAQQTLKTQNTTILNNSATMLTSLSQRNATLTTEQSTAVRTASTNLISTAGSLATTGATTADLQNIAAQTNSILAAQANLGVAADAALVDSVVNVSVQIATNLIRQQLGSGDDTPTDDEIREQLTSNPALLDAVIENTLQIPPSIVIPTEERNARIRNAAPDLPEQASNRARIATQKFVNPENVTIGGVNVLSILANFLSGPTTATLLDDSGRVLNVMALEAGQTEITVDDATGAVTIKVPGETYAGMIVAVRAVPSTVPNGLRFRTDGRVTVVTNGTAVDIAPTAVSVLGFIQAVETAGYAFTQNDNASFSLDLGGNQTFTGAFAYDNLVDENLTAACGAVGITEPSGPVNAPSYAFSIQCANGVSQRIVPFATNANFYGTIRAANLTAVTDRNTGIINVTGVGSFKPSFFVTQPTAAELEFHADAKDSLGIALQATDANNDGIVDYKVISAASVQIMYGVN